MCGPIELVFKLVNEDQKKPQLVGSDCLRIYLFLRCLSGHARIQDAVPGRHRAQQEPCTHHSKCPNGVLNIASQSLLFTALILEFHKYGAVGAQQTRVRSTQPKIMPLKLHLHLSAYLKYLFCPLAPVAPGEPPKSSPPPPSPC